MVASGSLDALAPGGEVGLGTANICTVGMTVATLGLPLATGFSVVAIWRHRRNSMNRAAYGHSALVTLGLVFMSSFFLTWGAIGLRSGA